MHRIHCLLDVQSTGQQDLEEQQEAAQCAQDVSIVCIHG